MTHLFGVDILTVKSHPQNWKTWDSDLFSDFNDMMSHFLLSLTSNKTAPDRFTLLPSMTTKQGGLGIQHPRSTAIPAYFLTMKCNIQCAIEGVWTSDHIPTINLPGNVQFL